VRVARAGEPPAALRAPRRRAPSIGARRLTALALAGGCAALALAALLASGVRGTELLLFAGFQLAFALLPGLVCYRLLIAGSRPLAEAVALVVALGLAIQIGCFALTAALGERWLFALYPAAFAAAGLALLHRHRPARARAPRGGRRARLAARAERADDADAWAPRLPALGAALAASATAACAVALVYLSLFAPSPLPREITSASYHPDLIFNVSLAAELLRHWPPMNPSVSGVALHYHFFVNVADAAVAQVTRLELATIVMRLLPAFLLATIALELFALGRRLAGGAGGLTAVALGLLAGELNFSRATLAGGGLPVLGFLLSPSYQLGAVFFLAILIVLVDGLGRPSPPARAGAAPALAVLAFGAVGAKSSVVPVLLAGLALFTLSRARSRAGLRSAVAAHRGALGVLAAAGAGGYALLYRGGGDGLALRPLDFLRYTAFAPVYGRASHSPAYALLCVPAGAVVLCALLVPLIGVALCAESWLGGRAAASPQRLLLCMLAVSLAPFALIAVPGDSQVYFLVYGFLAASVVSAAGLCGAIARARPAALAEGARRALAPLGALVLVALAIASELFELGAPTVERWLHGQHAFAASGAGSQRGLTDGLLRGLRWLRLHSRPSDVIAVNNHGLGGDGGSRYFYYSAFAERRVLLESWQYTPQGASYTTLGKTATPFPRLLALNDAAVLAASPRAIALLRERYGVRYIVIDRLHGPDSPRLGRVARLLYANPDVSVFSIARLSA
jgi:hypothetical protein